MSSDIAIKVENLSKSYQIYDRPRDRLKQMLMRGHRQYYREFWALKDISFEVKKGETVGIIGRNGSGKSTLLQLICGTLTPSAGSVKTFGRVAALLELGAGFNPEFSGRENVYMNASILGLTREEVDSRFDVIASFADIGSFMDQPVKTYSSGMYVRLAFAVMAHVDADILVIDEALAVGDAFFTQKCMRFLRKFMQTGTILLVSHDSSAVINLCQRAVLMDAGLASHIGSAKTVCEKYLASFYDDAQLSVDANFPQNADRKDNASSSAVCLCQLIDYDQRLDFINSTNLRNDIEIFAFNENSSSFGIKRAIIQNVCLMDSRDRRLLWVVGGECVKLTAEIECLGHVIRPIVGFFVKDRLGQVLFGDNTFLAYNLNPLELMPGERFQAVFSFRMPVLPMGEYSVCVSIAEGTQHEHVQHHWLHDALLIKSHSSSVTTGLVGIPMSNISLEKI